LYGCANGEFHLWFKEKRKKRKKINTVEKAQEIGMNKACHARRVQRASTKIKASRSRDKPGKNFRVIKSFRVHSACAPYDPKKGRP
jgi:hypothetical protein